MVFQRHSPREYQASRIDAAGGRLAAQVHLGGGAVAKQPQDAAFDFTQQSHPDIEHLRRDLVAVVETAKDEALRRQSSFRARRCPLRGAALRIADQIGIRKMNDFLGVKRLLVERQNVRIGKYIVVEAGAERAGKADIVDLNRGRTGGEDAGPRIRGIAAAVDSDVDLQFAQERSNLAIALRSHVVELIEGTTEPGADFALVIGAERNTQNLEPRSIMNLDKLCGEIRRRMLVKAARNIRNSDFLVTPSRAIPQLRRANRNVVANELPGTL